MLGKLSRVTTRVESRSWLKREHSKRKCFADSIAWPHRQVVVSKKPKLFWWPLRAQWPEMSRYTPTLGRSLRITDAELTARKKRRVAEPLIDDAHSSFQDL